jgi:hypothetical protein
MEPRLRRAAHLPECAGTPASSCRPRGARDRAGGRRGCARIVPAPNRCSRPMRSRPGGVVAPGRILPRQPQDQVADLIADAWPAGPVRVRRAPSEQPPVPGQQRGRGDDPDAATTFAVAPEPMPRARPDPATTTVAGRPAGAAPRPRDGAPSPGRSTPRRLAPVVYSIRTSMPPILPTYIKRQPTARTTVMARYRGATKSVFQI